MPRVELYGAAGCPHTRDMREWLEWKGNEIIEYDVEIDPAARKRLSDLAGSQITVPVLVRDGRVVQIGWKGRGCVVRGD